MAATPAAPAGGDQPSADAGYYGGRHCHWHNGRRVCWNR